MDILQILRTRIRYDYPNITEEEMIVCLKVATDMLRLNTFRNYK